MNAITVVLEAPPKPEEEEEEDGDEGTYDKTQHVLDREVTRKNTLENSLAPTALGPPVPHPPLLQAREDYSTIGGFKKFSSEPSILDTLDDSSKTERKTREAPVYSTVNKVPANPDGSGEDQAPTFTLNKFADDISATEDTLRELQGCIDDLESVVPPPIPPRVYENVAEDAYVNAAEALSAALNSEPHLMFDASTEFMISGGFGVPEAAHLTDGNEEGFRLNVEEPIVNGAGGGEQELEDLEARGGAPKYSLHSYETVEI